MADDTAESDQTPLEASLGRRVVRRLARERFITALLALNVGVFFTMAFEMMGESQSEEHFGANLVILIVIAVVMIWVLINVVRAED